MWRGSGTLGMPPFAATVLPSCAPVGVSCVTAAARPTTDSAPATPAAPCSRSWSSCFAVRCSHQWAVCTASISGLGCSMRQPAEWQGQLSAEWRVVVAHRSKESASAHSGQPSCPPTSSRASATPSLAPRVCSCAITRASGSALPLRASRHSACASGVLRLWSTCQRNFEPQSLVLSLQPFTMISAAADKQHEYSACTSRQMQLDPAISPMCCMLPVQQPLLLCQLPHKWRARTSAQRQRATREPASRPRTSVSSTTGMLAAPPAPHRAPSVLIAAYTCSRMFYPHQSTQTSLPLELL
jgi:hypothetical protein